MPKNAIAKCHHSFSFKFENPNNVNAKDRMLAETLELALVLSLRFFKIFHPFAKTNH